MMTKTFPKKCHFIGIGGIGMSALAKILLQKHVEVSGSDLKGSPIIDDLTRKGAKITIGHDGNQMASDMTVIYSTDIKKENEEYQAASYLKCLLWHRSELLQCLMHEKKGLAVAGMHGKTTTSSLLTSVLLEAQYDPSYIIGGKLVQTDSNGNLGVGEYLVAEADESDGSFLNYFPYGAIITNIDRDHMDFYGSEENVLSYFQKFLTQVSSSHHLFWCGDDPLLSSLNPLGFSYGFQSNCHWQIVESYQKNWSSFFTAKFQNKIFSNIELALVGEHNVLNALAVFALAIHLGIEERFIRSCFQKFRGVHRRCEKKAIIKNVLFIDDYAHHPTEIRATLKAVRQAIGNQRLFVIFQPHRYTRTQDCRGSFGNLFHNCDHLLITDIYSAGETPIAGISHDIVLKECQKQGQNAFYSPRAEIAPWIASQMDKYDVFLSLGAGDITKLTEEVTTLIH